MWRTVAEPDAVNLVLVAGSERALLVDTGSSVEQGRALRAAVAEVAGVPLEVVVVTHAHHDHVGGLGAFDDLTTVAHEDVPGVSRPIVLAAAFDLGGRRVEVAHVGRGHTGADLVVVVPDADLVVVGDLVESAAPPSLGPDSFLHEWPVTLDSVIGLMTGATRALPGHGDPVDRPYVYEQRGRLAAIATELRAARRVRRGRGRRRRAGRAGPTRWRPSPRASPSRTRSSGRSPRAAPCRSPEPAGRPKRFSGPPHPDRGPERSPGVSIPPGGSMRLRPLPPRHRGVRPGRRVGGPAPAGHDRVRRRHGHRVDPARGAGRHRRRLRQRQGPADRLRAGHPDRPAAAARRAATTSRSSPPVTGPTATPSPSSRTPRSRPARTSPSSRTSTPAATPSSPRTRTTSPTSTPARPA